MDHRNLDINLLPSSKVQLSERNKNLNLDSLDKAFSR